VVISLWHRDCDLVIVLIALQGYLNNVNATKDSITSDGWFKTGDIAIRDREGFYYIVDRRKELIKYKGFQGMCRLLTPC
jgi:long-subunit acyl-CoA synthetase (AMP-forming)